MTKVPYVHSGYARKENDDYQTIDPRCVDALVESVNLCEYITDICAPNGSGILRRLAEKGFQHLNGMQDAFGDLDSTNWIITNPPYDRKIVDRFVETAIKHIQSRKVYGACFLMRANWDFASSRARFFDSPLYTRQIRMRFRPWWSEERKAQPIHNYVWHVWERTHIDRGPTIIYWPRT
jgi:hypothetical protein